MIEKNKEDDRVSTDVGKKRKKKRRQQKEQQLGHCMTGNK